MHDPASAIAEFNAPPVVEVVAGVSFESKSDLAGPLLAAFWKERLRDNYPVLQIQPPYVMHKESFGESPGQPSFQIDFRGPQLESRMWASTADGDELLQIQQGWFACNWRKVQKDGKYDHWLARRDAFEHWYRKVDEFLTAELSEPVTIKQCELSYVNHIKATSDVWRTHAEWPRIFRASVGGNTSSPLEQVSAQAQFLITDDDGVAPIGRLHARMTPAFDADRKPLYVFELTARGAPFPDSDQVAGALSFLDRGREAIVNTFLELTTMEMHENWGMQK